MDICEEIQEAESGLGIITNKYAKACSFGNQTEEMRSDMLRMGAYIETLKRNNDKSKALPVNETIPEGTEIPFSALRSHGNNLILDTADISHNICIDYRPCLSDSDVCKIVEHARALLHKYNC